MAALVFDRSWYGRVLVERVEGFATGPEWRRAYGEIVAFERGLCEGHGAGQAVAAHVIEAIEQGLRHAGRQPVDLHGALLCRGPGARARRQKLAATRAGRVSLPSPGHSR